MGRAERESVVDVRAVMRGGRREEGREKGKEGRRGNQWTE